MSTLALFQYDLNPPGIQVTDYRKILLPPLWVILLSVHFYLRLRSHDVDVQSFAVLYDRW